MVAFLTSIVLTVLMAGAIRWYAPRRPAGTPLTWGEAYFGAVYVFALMFMLFGVLPDRWLQWADNELAWRSDVYGIPYPGGRWFQNGISFFGRGRILVPLQAIRDIIATVIYVIGLVALVYEWAWWQNRGKRTAEQEAAAAIETSAYGRPLVRGS